MVHSPGCSWYEAHAQVRNRECLLYSFLDQLLSFRSFPPYEKLLISQPASKIDRRKGFPNRTTAAMFVVTVINFLLSSLNAGGQVAIFIALTRKALVLDVGYPLLEKQRLVHKAVQNIQHSRLLGTKSSCEQRSLAIEFYVYSCSAKVLLSDLIVIWRAWALFPDQQWVILIPFILWIGAAGE